MRAIAILFAGTCFLATTSPAGAKEIKCPEAISESPTVSDNVNEWTVVASPGQRYLDSVGVYLGTITEYGSQTPDSTKANKGKEIDTWHIVRAKGDTFWVGCAYVGTTAMLFQKLDESISTCVATYDLLSSGARQRLHSVECQ